ncbi:hypothetical protein CMV_004884 [Castanea mollissima]|uniref:Uncharacterized protein n=1 Tax=Castanea mollissima TaxID=60419 RepID=A0A8J4RNB2_9ROSI|nr:hypothetical protein CMV_004884 [Castanea mollissima]
MSSGTSVDRNPCRKSNSGKGKAPEQSQNVTASSVDSSDTENISPLMGNDVGGVVGEETVFQNQTDAVIIKEIKSPTETEIELKANDEEISLAKEFGAAKLVGNRKEDSGLKAKVNEEITVELNKINEIVSDLEITVELTKINEVVFDLEASNEEDCLAKEFGAATLLRAAKRATKNPTSHDNLSDLSQLKKSRDFLEAKSLHSEPNHVASTWTHKERKTKGNTAGTYQPPGKKRVTRTEADLPAVSAKRFQADPRDKRSPSVVAGAAVQPRQQQ